MVFRTREEFHEFFLHQHLDICAIHYAAWHDIMRQDMRVARPLTAYGLLTEHGNAPLVPERMQ